MRFCDLTMAYNDASGGIRTYIDQKRKHILERTDHEHVLIVPGQEDREERSARAVTRWIASPAAPGHTAYRVLWRPDKIAKALRETEPDAIELASYFVEPWPAFAYRQTRLDAGRPCAVFGFFHTDLADAYIESPIEETLTNPIEGMSDTLERLGVAVAETIGAGAERYFGAIFERCDQMLAATPQQVERLRDYGVDDGRLTPLGVDLDVFHPSRRSADVRARYGAGERDLMLVYAGRLDHEKRVEVLVNAYRRLLKRKPGDGWDAAHLVMLGEGPQRRDLEAQAESLPGLHVAGFERDKTAVAALLASADVYVSAGPHETFGLSIVEAQACGLPVVGVDAGALAERVVEGTGYLGEVDDADAMAQNIRRAAAERESLGAAGRRHVEEHFGWEATFRSLIEDYEQRLGAAVS